MVLKSSDLASEFQTAALMQIRTLNKGISLIGS